MSGLSCLLYKSLLRQAKSIKTSGKILWVVERKEVPLFSRGHLCRTGAQALQSWGVSEHALRCLKDWRQANPALAFSDKHVTSNNDVSESNDDDVSEAKDTSDNDVSEATRRKMAKIEDSSCSSSSSSSSSNGYDFVDLNDHLTGDELMVLIRAQWRDPDALFDSSEAFDALRGAREEEFLFDRESVSSTVTEDIRIVVNAMRVDDPATPEYVYRVRVENIGDRTVQVLGRHWSIQDGSKAERAPYVVPKGSPGVVGMMPILRKGEAYVYVSGIGTDLIASGAVEMEGSLQMLDIAEDEIFDAAISAFKLKKP